MEASTRLAFAQKHALVLVILAQTVLEVLGVEVAKTDAGQVRGDSLA